MRQPGSLVQASQVENVALISITGYFNEEIGDELNRVADVFLKKGLSRMILDLTPCQLVNSTGIAALMALTLNLVQERKGHLFLVGCSPIMIKAFCLATIIPRATQADTVDIAFKSLKALQAGNL